VPLDERIADGRPGPDVRSSDHSRLQKVLVALHSLPEIDRAAVLMRANGEGALSGNRRGAGDLATLGQGEGAPRASGL
jgi:hypothetical protein